MTPADPVVRDATEADLPGILAIHNAAIESSTALWSEETDDLEDRRRWMADRRAHGWPVLVAEVDGVVAGYASYGWWRPRSGYRHTMEHSVYVADDHQRRGLATALLADLFERAEVDPQVHVMVAAIESTNRTSIELHERFGFRIVGQMPEVGTKFGRWLDLTLMQRPMAVAT